MESYASFLKQHSLLVEGLHQMGFKSSPEGLWCPAFIAVGAHKIMSI